MRERVERRLIEHRSQFVCFENTFCWARYRPSGETMWKVAQDMARVAEQLEVPFELLSSHEAEEVRQSVLRKFTTGSPSWPIWEHLEDRKSIHDAEGWRLISEFVREEECVVFWEPRLEQQGMRFRNGRDLVRVLGETYGTEFYVTDPATSYVICFNHHDYLIGAGRGRDWIARQMKSGQ